jgi:multidrug efflux pump
MQNNKVTTAEKSFTDIFIKRPVFATCLSLMIFLTGLVSMTHMDLRQFPKVNSSVITITVTYPGATSDVMEGFITTPIEEAISAVDGIDYITSQNTEGQSVVSVNMQLNANVDAAMTEINSDVSSLLTQFPKDINNPVITKSDAGSYPLLFLQASSTTLDTEALTDYLIRVVQPQLQMVDGVSQAEIMGERMYAMRIWLDPYLMASRNITSPDVYNAINNYNVIAPSGAIKTKYQEIDLYSSTDLKTAEDFDNMLLRNDGGQIVRIKDVGKAMLGAANTDFSVFANGKPSTFIAIMQKSDANPLTIQQGIIQLLNKIRPSFPQGVSVDPFYDFTKYISSSIHEVVVTLVEACIFVFLVIFFMLGSFRSVFVPLVTIPLSLMGACIIMLALGFSLNLLTLLAFVLAIGLVVDDAIVVLENVHRHLEEGLTPKQAALTGAHEISFAVIAMTLTLAAVYAPIGFMGGLTGSLFTEFAFTLAGAVIVSGFVALTLSPMMCSKIYRQGENLHAGLAGVADKFFDKLRAGYKRLLKIMIKARYIVLVGALAVYGLCYFLYSGLQSELAPVEDQSAFFVIGIGPAAANLDFTETQTAKQVKLVQKLVPELESVAVVNGYPTGINSSFGLVVLKPWEDRKRTAMEMRDKLFFPLWSIPGMEFFPSLPPALPGPSGFTPVMFVLRTIGDYPQLEQSAKKLMQEAQQWGGVVNLNTDLKIDQPQVHVEVDRDKAAMLGISMQDISLTLNTFLSMPIVNYFEQNGRSYQVLPQLYRKYRNIPDALNNLNLRAANGDMVPLANLVKITEDVIPESRNHFQQLRSATINANLSPGVSLGTALQKLEQLAKTTLPAGILVDYAGESRQLIQESGNTWLLFLFALVFIYLVLAAQFESFRDPFIVMLTVPLAVTGAFLGLYVCDGTLNIYTNIGLVTLIGLITKNGILIVEFANQKQEKGAEFLDAIIDGAATRLRPILMTTFAMILGSVPLMLASGAGAVSRAQMGFVIVFGISFGTLLTLFVVPTAYYLFATKKKVDIAS